MSTLSLSLGKPSGTALALLLSVFIVASCGLAYELLAAALASHLLGDSITQFSTVIGAYLFAMGIGSALSRYLDNEVENCSIKSLLEVLIEMLEYLDNLFLLK